MAKSRKGREASSLVESIKMWKLRYDRRKKHKTKKKKKKKKGNETFNLPLFR